MDWREEKRMENGQLDTDQILAQVDALYEENKGEEAEQLMLRSVEEAVRLKDDGARLQLQNELLGYYRETSQREKVYQMASEAIEHAKAMGLEGTVPYATTLLNVATAYRACGRLEESKEYYARVQEIYDSQLEPDSMLMAGLKNNIALLYQETGDFAAAKEKLLEALAIVTGRGVAYEMAVTYANLASTCMQLRQSEEAREYALKSVEIFEREGVADSHYAAALATLGAYSFHKKDFKKALEHYTRGMEAVERNLGRNEYYHRLQENAAACERALVKEEQGAGLALARQYYESCGRQMIEERFPAYAGKIAVGLAGRGSDSFGYDDAASRDHDWGPDFCMWVTDGTYEEIGKELQQAYESLPEEFGGYKRASRVNGRNRRGVIRISEFFEGLVGAASYEEIDWRSVSDFGLAAAVNGEVFRDDEGVFTAFRDRLKEGYPEDILYLKLAESAARFSQTAQYNYLRMLRRGDILTAQMMVWDGLKEAMKLQHYIERKYPPHDKWLYRSLTSLEQGGEMGGMLQDISSRLAGSGVMKNALEEEPIEKKIERVASYFAAEMYRAGFISDTDSYLDAHSEELVYKASLLVKEKEALVEEIAKLEFEAFDKVKNEGGRASCQNDWATFSIMRKSQYLTWNRNMLIQYLYDFHREYRRGHNLIEEKYGRMMESTAPEKYEEIKSYFPELTQEKKEIIEQIVRFQVGWMEKFSEEYPELASNARNIHTYEDNSEDTSYETYLRGELGTYSDKMLELYGRYVVGYARSGKNLTRDIMELSVKMYGYADVEDAERKMEQAWKK